MTTQSGRSQGGLLGAGVLILAIIALLLAVQVFRSGDKGVADSIDASTTPYQAVLLNNGLAYFGHVDKQTTRFLTLTDVYYIRSGVNQGQAAKAQPNVLVKRGKEWHEPDRMTINIADIVFIEPVKPSSTVGKLIEQSKAKGD